ncbi:Uncharacterized protein GBIM_10798 [Gryllus bimaculatus]|nr:Uncharacterized protein GBIM_10798 [Gryllus bimaculatus]
MRRRQNPNSKVGDIVAIKRIQFGPNLKLKAKNIGPYRITNVKVNDTNDVRREGDHEGPRITSTCVEYMQPWPDGYSPSESDDCQDGRLRESEEECLGFTAEEESDAV